MRNLVHDTLYRRARRRVIDVAHAADETLSRLRGDRRRILLEATSPVSVAIVSPVFQRLQADARLDFWFTSSDANWNTRDLFAHSGLRGEVISPSAARWHRFDLYVNTDFWNMTWLPRRTRRLHMFHGVAGKYDLDAPTRLAPTVATFDRLFFPNRDRLARYVQAGLVDPQDGTAALVGYPKVDCLVDGSLDRDRILASLGLDPRRPTLMYAPTWSPYSSLNDMGDAIVRTLMREDANVIVKLHDRAYDAAARASGGIDWRRYLERFTRESRMHVATGADASPYLFVADTLVTDHSSVAFEFMLLDRPVIVMECPQLAERARINPQKLALMREAAETVRTVEELPTVLRQVRETPWVRGARRRAIADDLFFDPGHAATRAAAALYDLIALPHPASLASALAAAQVAVPVLPDVRSPQLATLNPELTN